MATNSSILAWRIPWTGEPGDGVTEFDMTELLVHKEFKVLGLVWIFWEELIPSIFVYLGKTLVFLPFLKTACHYSILGWQLLSFSTLNILSRYLLTCKVFAEKFMWFPCTLQVGFFFCFQISIFGLNFDSLILICLIGDLSSFSLGFLWASWIWESISFLRFGKLSAIISLNKFSGHFFFYAYIDWAACWCLTSSLDVFLTFFFLMLLCVCVCVYFLFLFFNFHGCATRRVGY